MGNAPFVFPTRLITAKQPPPDAPLRYRLSDLQDFGDCTQSSQIGPHLVQPLSASPTAITLPSIINLRNMDVPIP